MAGWLGSNPIWLTKQDKKQDFSENLCISLLGLGLGVSSQAALNHTATCSTLLGNISYVLTQGTSQLQIDDEDIG